MDRTVDSGDSVRSRPKSTVECSEAGVAVPMPAEELSMVETEPFVLKAVFGLSSKDGLWMGSRADAIGCRNVGCSLICDAGSAPAEVLGR